MSGTSVPGKPPRIPTDKPFCRSFARLSMDMRCSSAKRTSSILGWDSNYCRDQGYLLNKFVTRCNARASGSVQAMCSIMCKCLTSRVLHDFERVLRRTSITGSRAPDVTDCGNLRACSMGLPSPILRFLPGHLTEV